MRNLTPTTTYDYSHSKHEKIGLGEFKELEHKFTQVQVMEMVYAAMATQIQVHTLGHHTMLVPRTS